MGSRCCLILTAVGLAALAACGHSSESPGTGGPTPIPPAAAIWYTAIGASDAAGVGSSLPCIPFTACPDGMGYVPRVARQLRADGHTVTLTNMGIPGAVLSPATQQLGNQYGLGIQSNFLEHEAPFVPKDTTLVTMFAGGNDAKTIGTAIDRGAASPADADAYIDRQITSFASDYASLLAAVRGRANNPRIIVLNLPNFAGLPFMAGRTAQQKRWIERLSVGFSTAAANRFATQGVIVIDLLCDARSYQSSNYSSDGFHPNDQGYAYLAGEVLDAVNAPSWPSPATSCSQMHLAP
jgi:lysophospholipase L1-like esterase